MQRCKLVHGDLSEYNMLGTYLSAKPRAGEVVFMSSAKHASCCMAGLRLHSDGKLYIIDVSQSVESDHPQALDFLKRDCVNAGSFCLCCEQHGGLDTTCPAKVNNFFAKRTSTGAVPVKRLFDFAFGSEDLLRISRCNGSPDFGLRLLRASCQGFRGCRITGMV